MRQGILLACGLAFLLAGAPARAQSSAAAAAARTDATPESRDAQAAKDTRALADAVAAMPPQRPGHPDLYVVGFAGDGFEPVFDHEVRYLAALADARLDAGGRTLVLSNRAARPGDAPSIPATLASLDDALARIGGAMDRDEDLLLLYMTMHGTDDHFLVQRRGEAIDGLIPPGALAAAIAASGIRHRVVVVSACYSGGFIPALESPDALVLTAAHRRRPSFGCGSASTVTWFGRAWMVEGLNRDADFAAAFEQALPRIRGWERAEGFRASKPQIATGERIEARLQAWRAALPPPGPPLPYPHPLPAD